MLQSIHESAPNTYSATVLPTWLQGRTAFGGLSCALVVEAMLRQVPDDRRLRSIAVSFVGPVPAGDHVIELQPLRDGGSVTHIRGELFCDTEVSLSLLATFGKDRPSELKVAASKLPETNHYSNFEDWPFVKGVTPAFTQNFNIRLAHGGMPLSGAKSADFGIWTRFSVPHPISTPALIALGDVPPMPGLNMIKPPGVGSSLTWYLEFPFPPKAWADDSWWYTDYSCQSARNGYFHNVANVWNEDGSPVLYARQVATIFAK